MNEIQEGEMAIPSHASGIRMIEGGDQLPNFKLNYEMKYINFYMFGWLLEPILQMALNRIGPLVNRTRKLLVLSNLLSR